MQISHTCKEVLHRIRLWFGGHVYVHQRPRKPHHRPTWQWRLSGVDALRLSLRIAPQLNVRASDVSRWLLDGFDRLKLDGTFNEHA